MFKTLFSVNKKCTFCFSLTFYFLLFSSKGKLEEGLGRSSTLPSTHLLSTVKIPCVADEIGKKNKVTGFVYSSTVL